MITNLSVFELIYSTGLLTFTFRRENLVIDS